MSNDPNQPEDAPESNADSCSSAMIRCFPGQDIRVESGPIRFGDDWAGTFFRGDHSFGHKLTLDAFIHGEPNSLDMACLEAISDCFGECDQRKRLPDFDNEELRHANQRMQESRNEALRYGMSIFEYGRLVDWLKDENRKPPSTAFTAGVLRTVGYAMVEAGILETM